MIAFFCFGLVSNFNPDLAPRSQFRYTITARRVTTKPALNSVPLYAMTLSQALQAIDFAAACSSYLGAVERPVMGVDGGEDEPVSARVACTIQSHRRTRTTGR